MNTKDVANIAKANSETVTVDALYRLYKKTGPISFEFFIKKHPEYYEKAMEAINMDRYKIV